MTLLGWSMLIILIALIAFGYWMLPRFIKVKKLADFTGIYMLLLSLVTAVGVGIILFIPMYLLVCEIMPNEPHNGHYAMPLGQAIIGGALAILAGLISAIVALIKMARWRKRLEN